MTKFITPWMADRESTVHFRNCGSAGTAPSPYTPVMPTAPGAPVRHVVTADEMAEHLGRTDVSNGHSAPSLLMACVDCIAPLVGSDG